MVRTANIKSKKKAQTAESSKGKKKLETKKKVSAKKSAEADEMPQLIDCIVEAILDKKGKGVCSLDLRKLGTSICDYFVICNADSSTNVSAIADNIEDELLKKMGRKILRTQGKENCFWIIQDYGDVVVHIFQTQYREFYRLEELWSDCEIKNYED